MTSITDEAIRLKQKAHAGPIGKRQSSRDLYQILSECYDLAERCRGNPAERQELGQLVREQPSDGKGRWVARDSDEYLLVCRFVFPRTGSGRGELSNASRYAHCMREAAKQKIGPCELYDALANHGGINRFYLGRPLERTTIVTKALRLTDPVEVPKGGTITLTLRHRPDNAFEVVQQFAQAEAA